jgi:hypothetical protein
MSHYAPIVYAVKYKSALCKRQCPMVLRISGIAVFYLHRQPITHKYVPSDCSSENSFLPSLTVEVVI